MIYRNKLRMIYKAILKILHSKSNLNELRSFERKICYIGFVASMELKVR